MLKVTKWRERISVSCARFLSQ